MKKRDRFFLSVIIAISLLLIASALCIVLANRMSANTASIVGGVLSAVATALLGIIAFWQNKKYKELSDELNERAFLPELYKAETIGEKLQGEVRAAYNHLVFSVDPKDELVDVDCGNFLVLKPPILDITVKSISYKGKTMTLYGDRRSLLSENAAFNLLLKIPVKYQNEGGTFEIILMYENIYRTRYEKTLKFNLSPGASMATGWIFIPSRRIG